MDNRAAVNVMMPVQGIERFICNATAETTVKISNVGMKTSFDSLLQWLYRAR
jgi:hypothetical protein